MEAKKKKEPFEIKGEAILFTGAALVGGSKLVYEIGKDVYERFKTENKFFIQLLDSRYEKDCHVIKANFASAHIHSIYIESITVDVVEETDVRFAKSGGKIGYSGTEIEKVFPILVLPGKAHSIDIVIAKIEQTQYAINNGAKITFKITSVDDLSEAEDGVISARLRWPQELIT